MTRSCDTLYVRNNRGRYERAGVWNPIIPEGLHLVYVQHKPGSKSTLSTYNISLEEVNQKAVVMINQDKITDAVMAACSLYPCEKLTEEEGAEWEDFKKTKAGKKLCKGMYRKSATDIARTILKEVVTCTT